MNRIVVKHAGAGGEQAAFNTKAFTIQLSTDGSTWQTPVTVTGNADPVTTHQITATAARYVRLNVTTPTQNADTATRIYELEVYGGSALTNLALNRPATGTTPCAGTEGPEKAVNGSVSGGNPDKFCSAVSGAWLQVDLGSTRAISRFEVAHAQAGGEPAAYNTKAFTIDVSTDGTNWVRAVTVTANTAGETAHPVGVSGRYVRLTVTAPTQGTDTATRIYELRAFG